MAEPGAPARLVVEIVRPSRASVPVPLRRCGSEGGETADGGRAVDQDDEAAATGALDPAGAGALDPAGAGALDPAGPAALDVAGAGALDPAGPAALDVAGPGALDVAGPGALDVGAPPGRFHGTAAGFTVGAALGPPAGADGRTLELDVHYEGEEVTEATVRLRAETPARDPWWLIPGLFYGENRPEGCDRIFPRFAVGADDPAGMVSCRWEFRADRAATPAVFAWGGGGGVALLTAETSPLGTSGLGLAHEEQTGSASVSLLFPYRETPVTYYGSAQPLPAQVAGHRWRPGERVRLEARAYSLGGDRHAYAPILRAEHARQRHEAGVQPWVSIPEAADLTAHGLLTWHYDPDPGVLLETVGFDREVTGRDGRPVDRQAMHVAWISGIPWAYALLAHGRRTGRAAEVEAARSVIDHVCANLAPAGTFWGRWDRALGWRASWSPIPDGLHQRTLAEATLFLLRALDLEGPGRAAPSWTAAARANLRAAVRHQRADGNLGSVVHARTGEVLSWRGASGLTWVAALAEAGGLDDDGACLAAAVRAGEYYASFVEAEFINGAPEDVDLAPTAEDGYAAVMAYVALHRRTGAPRWLDLARRAADWMLTFRYTYDVRFDPRTLLGAYGFATRGADQASVSNQHLGAYGLVCTSELVELSVALGDPHYAERAMETLACFRQFVARQDGDFNAYRGMVTERYYHTTCFQPKGMLLTLSHAWSVGVLLLACEQALAADRPA
ncbi:hypothetical protein MF406_08825 [Georgenia sp. TF02-10]|uniref:hypothetical protein n=1 Tax=Georgenia sp. TF02-10 TaxID=2917725 RepID=UPI001FA76A69|nr:hypothetical protein [Georgenia sp. TF02-10]UNX56278.1 hypothetical protein MF406_08825 [Georgenia sp. TF02-10]